MANKELQAEKLKALQLTMEKLDKTFGKGAVMKLGDNPVEKVDVIPTGSLTLDLALGINGYPKGRVVEIYGPESSGKTTLAIHAIAEVQKQGGIAAFIDAVLHLVFDRLDLNWWVDKARWANDLFGKNTARLLHLPPARRC